MYDTETLDQYIFYEEDDSIFSTAYLYTVHCFKCFNEIVLSAAAMEPKPPVWKLLFTFVLRWYCEY